jgi:hypothetical protein
VDGVVRACDMICGCRLLGSDSLVVVSCKSQARSGKARQSKEGNARARARQAKDPVLPYIESSRFNLGGGGHGRDGRRVEVVRAVGVEVEMEVL